jgi:arylesterase/paraoxonase
MRVLVVLLLVVLMFAGLGVSWLLDRAGQFQELEAVAAGTCTAVEGAVGAEDLTTHPAGYAFISSMDRRTLATGRAVNGAIYLYDMRSEEQRPIALETDFEGIFRPHGLSLYRGSDGAFLHVVNHPPRGHTIEIFEWLDGRLAHRETVSGELLWSPNDVLAVGPRRFYATNDHGRTEGAARLLEDYLQRPLANVVYFDGERLRIVADEIAYANGINMSQDGRELYVGATTGKKIHFYMRDLSSGDLHENGTVNLASGVDNIEVDRHGMLWVGAHPKLFSFVAHAGDAENLSPSQVIWVDPDESLDPPIRHAFVDLGETLSGSSVAAPWGSRLLIGSVFEPHFLDCERDPEAARSRESL